MALPTNTDEIPTTFDRCLEDSKGSTRHLLLGNGFSIAHTPEFKYKCLLKAVNRMIEEIAESDENYAATEKIRDISEKINKKDFELIIRELENASKFAKILGLYYSSAPKICGEEMEQHAQKFKNILIEAIINVHPKSLDDESNTQTKACQEFLKSFIGSESGKGEGHVFTLNYDFLLYWAICRSYENNKSIFQIHNEIDGFPGPKPYELWEKETAKLKQRIHFLHGAVHLYEKEEGEEKKIEKLTYYEDKTKGELLKQLKEKIANGAFPIFVAEGESKDKEKKIYDNDYLRYCLKTFIKKTEEENSCFFVHGCSFSENDNHIFEELKIGNFEKLYVSIHGKVESRENRKIIRIAKQIAPKGNKNNVFFYDAKSINIWNKEPR